MSPKEEKLSFVNLARSDRYTVSELCGEFGISRKTGHKWPARYSEGGEKGREEPSRSPQKGVRTGSGQNGTISTIRVRSIILHRPNALV